MPNCFTRPRGTRLRAYLTLVLAALAACVATALIYAWIGHKAPSPWGPPRPVTASEPLRAGTPAPDFALTPLSGGEPVRLHDLLRGRRPVVLIFSSFTCAAFTTHQPYLLALYRDYRDRAEFLTVVVREAEHQLPGVEFLLPPEADPRRRCGLVRRAVALREWPVPTALDSADAVAESAYRAFPLRLVVVAPDGRIAFATRFMPRLLGLDRVAVDRWFESHLGAPAS
jgi:hypothetical protein